jgi:hypothetical protein
MPVALVADAIRDGTRKGSKGRVPIGADRYPTSVPEIDQYSIHYGRSEGEYVRSRSHRSCRPTDIKAIIEPYMLPSPSAKDWLTRQTVWHVNPTGKFVIGGTDGDTQLIGRRISRRPRCARAAQATTTTYAAKS